MKTPLKIGFNTSDMLLVLVNLVPLLGVWFRHWNVKEMFLVYCLESVIMGIYNVLMMFLTTLNKGKDYWQEGDASSLVSGYYFILFFIAHYGFFLLLQISLFLGIADIGNLGFTDVFTFLFHIKSYLSSVAVLVLLLFVILYGIVVLKDFVIPGFYKTASLGSLMFAPYPRVFVQQFCVIGGGFLLTFNLGKIFMLVFIVVKIFFDILMKYNKVQKAIM